MTADVANQLFGAIEAGDYAGIEALWADDVTVWHSGDAHDNDRRRALKVIRWFLDRTATHILAWEGTDDEPGRWFWFEGNFASYEANKVERLGAEAARPHRVTHRRLTRD